VCRGPAGIEGGRHNAAFCPEHFVTHCRGQVRRAVHDHRMLEPGDRVLVAVSGGKDSLALWELLVDLGEPGLRADLKRMARERGTSFVLWGGARPAAGWAARGGSPSGCGRMGRAGMWR